jgi:hypothetical protein
MSVSKYFKFAQPTISRQVETFPTNVGTDIEGPMDPSSSVRLSNRIHQQSRANATPTSVHTSLTHQILIDQEVQGLLSKKALCSTYSMSGTRVYQFPFCSIQKGGKAQTCDQSKTPELLCPLRTLQDGIYSNAERSFKKRGLYDKDIFKGRLPNTSNKVLYQGQGKSTDYVIEGQHFGGNIHKQDGGTHSPLLSYLSKDLWDIPGVQNVEADRESRVFLDSSDWKLNPSIFNCLYQTWGPLTIDLFASRLITFQLGQFVSWRPDPLATCIDAFTLDWAKFRGYAFPLFALRSANVYNKSRDNK